MKGLLAALALTLALELGYALVWGVRGRRALALVALVNCLTNPPVNLLYTYGVTLGGLPDWPVTAVLECAAVLAEWLVYRRAEDAPRRPFLFSLCANAFSYCAGCLIQLR